MWSLETPWYELTARGTCIYFIIFILMRLWGKKHLSQVTLFDFILLLFISEAIQNSIIDDEKSITGGIIVVITFLFWNMVIDRLAYRLPWSFSGKPLVIIKDGQILHDVKRREFVTDQELYTALREHGVEDLRKVKQATIETNGNISVIEDNQ